MSKGAFSIPRGVSDIKEGDIPYSMAEFTADSGCPELEPFLISFKFYKIKNCEIKHLQQSPAKKSLDCLIKMGNLDKIEGFAGKNIGTKPVENKGAYRFLYNGLSSDVEIREHLIGGSERLFYSVSIGEKIVYIILIKNKHINA